MRPPKGFENEKYPLRHKLIAKVGLNMGSENQNTFILPIVMSSTDMDVIPSTINVNPHNPTNYDEDGGPLVRHMSIIDRMTISLKFNMVSEFCGIGHETAGTYGANGQTAGTFTGDDINAIKFLWRPIFNVYPEKMDAADDATGTTVAAILGFTKDSTNEDLTPITTNPLVSSMPATTTLPVSTVNSVQVFGDFNMSDDLTLEDHVWDESLLQAALMRYTNKGALRSCLGRTRHVTLTRSRPAQNFYIDKFVPNAIRRVQPYGWFGIQVHVPLDTDPEQISIGTAASASLPHLGVSIIANYHEWNIEHDQGMLTA